MLGFVLTFIACWLLTGAFTTKTFLVDMGRGEVLEWLLRNHPELDAKDELPAVRSIIHVVLVLLWPIWFMGGSVDD